MPEPAISLTAAARSEGILEAMNRAITDIPEIGDDNVQVYARWSKTLTQVGVVVKVKNVKGQIVAEKRYDDLAVVVAASIRL